MRRSDREITDFTQMLAIVQDCSCCRIGLVDREEAYIVPLNFGYEVLDGTLILYFHSAAEGRKIDLLPSQKTVCFEMDTGHALVAGSTACKFSFLYRSVMGRGTMEILAEAKEKRHGMNRIMAHYSDADHWEFPPEMLDRTQILKLTVTDWSCKVH